MSDKIMTEEKTEALALRWLQKATRDSKDIFSCILCKGERAEATDSFRIHLAPKPRPLADYEDRALRVRDGKALHKSAGRVYPVEELEGKFPDIDQYDPSQTQKPVFEIAVNADFLRDALEVPNEDAPGNRIRLSFYSETGPFVVESDDGKYKAIVMPMESK